MSLAILSRYVFAPATEDTAYLCNDVSGAGPFTQLHTSMPDGLAHQVAVVNNSATNHSGKTVAIVGTDADGKAQTETITAPGSSATVESTKYFLTVSSVTPSATIGADTFDVGYVDEFVSPSMPLNYRSAIGAKFFLDVTGTINCDVQFSIADPALFVDQESNKWVKPYSSLDGETADSTAVVAADPGYAFWRFKANSYSASAAASLYVSQPG